MWQAHPPFIMANRKQHPQSFQGYQQATTASLTHDVYNITYVEPSERKSPRPTDGPTLPPLTLHLIYGQAMMTSFS
jgi:hypothetical protein